MKRITLISVALVFATLWLASCQREPAVQPVTKADKTIPSHHVPREKALAELNAFLADVDANNTTRGGKVRQIKDVMPILSDKFQNATRVSENEAAAAIDTLLYMVNFENEEGFAILSAADFLAPIIAVMDQGNADSSMMENIAGSIWDFDDDDCCIGYYEDELEEEAADTTDLPIIGNPVIGGLSSHSNEITRTSESSSAVNHTLKFVLRTVSDYCEYKMIDHNNPAGSDDNSGGNTGGNSGSNTGDEGDNSGDNGGNTSPQDWVTISQVQPMLQTNWHQVAPFNFFCPEREGGSPEFEGRAPVGCPAIALGQVIAYHRFPAQIGDVALLWDYISYPLHEDDEMLIFKEWHIAKFLYELGDKFIEQDYHYDKSGATMRRVRIAMERLGFRNVSKNCGYRENDIMEHLNTQRPFIIGASSPKNARIGQKKGGHAWVIDGYIKRQRNNQIEIMMHCNMGNGGWADGYYQSGIFNTTTVTDENENLLYDEDDDKYNFCRYYRNINYDKPTPQL